VRDVLEELEGLGRVRLRARHVIRRSLRST
jgi:hypothetical protein